MEQLHALIRPAPELHTVKLYLRRSVRLPQSFAKRRPWYGVTYRGQQLNNKKIIVLINQLTKYTR